MKAMCSLGYHHNVFVATLQLEDLERVGGAAYQYYHCVSQISRWIHLSSSLWETPFSQLPIQKKEST